MIPSPFLIVSQRSHWFRCSCPACSRDWPGLEKLPRDYLNLAGSHFRYNRCNRKALQKDVERTRARIRKSVTEDGDLEAARRAYNEWIGLLDELIVPPHRDFVHVRRGMRSCLWLQTPNVCRVKEDEALVAKKEKYRQQQQRRRNQ